MKLRFLKGRFSGREVDVNPAGFIVGRVDTNDLQIDEEGISRRHGRFFYDDGTWFVEDMGSTNGIRVNGAKVTGRFAIKAGDRIGLFNQTLIFTSGSDIVDISALASGGGDATSAVAGLPSLSGHEPREPEETGESSPAADLAPTPAPIAERQAADESSTPWGRIVVLLFLVAVLAWFLKITLQPKDEDRAIVDTPVRETTEATVESTAFDEPETVVIEMPGMVEDGDFKDDETIPVVQVVAFDDEPTAAVPDVPDGEERVAPAGPPVTILVESIPGGADVVIGDIHRGKTPLMLRNLPIGRHELKLSKAGYEELVRQIRVPDVLPEKPYMMQLKPGTLRLSSTPEGATVLHGTQMIGTTPLVMTEMPAGLHEFQFVKFGYESAKREIAISSIEGREETVVLNTLLGAVDFITVPAGCRIYVDNMFKGVTVAGDRRRSRSQPFRVAGLGEGEHIARVEHPNGVSKSDVIRIRRGVAIPVVVELWVVDTKLTLVDGNHRFGMLFSVNDDGDVIITERQAGEREAIPRQYLREQIAEMTEVEPPEGREIMRRLGLLKRDGAPPATPGGQAAVQGPLEIGNGDWAAGDGQPDVALKYTAKQLTTMIRENSATAMAKMVGGREVVLTGVPTDVTATLMRAEIKFGRAITCEIDRVSYERFGHEIRHALDEKRPITIRGRTVAHAQSVTLRNCTFVTEEVGQN